MTKHSPYSGGDAPVVISPQMIDAGVRVFLESYPDTAVGDSQDRQMIAEIYAAMRPLAHAEI
jgi:hypothetical protein